MVSINRIEWLEGRRSRIQIVAEILRLLRLGEVGKTEMYTIKMSYSQLQRYLSSISELRLMDTYKNEHSQVIYRITKKELELLTRIEAMQEMLNTKETFHILDSPEIISGVDHRHTSLSK